MRDYLPKVAYFILGVSFIVVGLIIYWQLQPADVLEIRAPITVKPPVASSGSPVILHFSYCKKLEATGTIRVSFVSKTAEIFQPVGTDAQPAGCHITDLPLLLPPATLVPAGKYVVKFHAMYKINPLKTTMKDFYTEEFTIAN